MNLDKTAQDSDLSNIPAEFRENYRFLSELINCRDKNAIVAECLGTLVDRRLCRLRGKLNKRQLKILNEFMDRLQDDDPDWFSPTGAGGIGSFHPHQEKIDVVTMGGRSHSQDRAVAGRSGSHCKPLADHSAGGSAAEVIASVGRAIRLRQDASLPAIHRSGTA